MLGDDVWLCLEVAAKTIRSHIGNQDMFWKHIMMRWSDVIPASKAAPGQAVRTQTLMKGSACVPENDIKCNEGSIGSLFTASATYCLFGLRRCGRASCLFATGGPLRG